MKNSRGEVNMVTTIIIIFVTLIVGVVLFQVIAQQVGDSTNTITVNSSETLATNGNSIYIEEYRALTGVTIYNASDYAEITDGNYTITNNAINPTTTDLSVKLTTDDAEFGGNAVYVTGTGQPLDYIADSGGRVVASLIVIFFALAIAVVALYPVFGSKVRELLGM